MSNLDWSALLDLLTEDRNDTSVTAKDIAKACGDKLCSLLMAIEALAVNLANTL